MSAVIVPIVEGHGDVEAIGVLIRRIDQMVSVKRPLRLSRSKMTRDSGEVERYVAIARSSVRESASSAIVLMLDQDEDCAAELGPKLLESLQSSSGSVRCFVAIAVREFESWIVGGIESLGVDDPEQAGKPKARLHKFNGGKYQESVDQAKLTSRIDVARLEVRSPSFRRFARFIREFGSSASVF